MTKLLTLTILTAAALFVAPASQAALITYTTDLTGSAEAVPNVSPGTGTAVVGLDTAAHVLQINLTFTGLVSTTAASHIHCCVASGTVMVATLTPGFPSGLTSGTYQMTFDTSQASTWNPAFISANGGSALTAEAAFAEGLADGEAYFDIHTSIFPGGEIRGFLTAVPEPASLVLFGAGLAGLGLLRRRKRS